MRTGISDVLTRRRIAQVIFKEFKYNKETGDLVVDTSPINWKDGCNLTLKVRFSSSPCPSFASRDRSSLLAAVAGRLCLVPPPPLRPSHLAPELLVLGALRRRRRRRPPPPPPATALARADEV